MTIFWILPIPSDPHTWLPMIIKPKNVRHALQNVLYNGTYYIKGNHNHIRAAGGYEKGILCRDRVGTSLVGSLQLC